MSLIYIFIVTFLISGNFLLSQEKNYLVRTFKKHKEAVNSVKISPDGRHLLSGSADKSIILWDIATGNDLLILKTFQEKFRLWNFLRMGNSGNIIKLWKINGEYVNTFREHSTDIWSLKFAPDGKSFVSGSFDRSFRVWDFLEIRLLQTIEGHKKSVLTVTIDPGGKRIASCSNDQTIRLWTIKPEIFVNYYYKNELDREISTNELFAPKSKSGSREAYRKRLDKAEEFEKEIHSRFYKEYREKLRNNKLIEKNK